MAIALGVLLIWQLERLPLFEGASSPEPVQAPSARAAIVVPRRRQAEPQAENAATDRALA